MKFLLSLVFLMISNTAFASGTAVSVRIELLNSATINIMEVRLSDIARIDVKQPTVKKTLAELVVARFTKVGQRKVIYLDQIKRKIKSIVPRLDIIAEWQGVKSVYVLSSGKDLKAEEYIEHAKQHLIGKLLPLYDLIRIAAREGYKDLLIPYGSISYSILQSSTPVNSGKQLVWLEISVSNKPYKTLPIWFDVELYKTGLTVSEDVNVNETVNPEKLVQKLSDVTNKQGPILNNISRHQKYRFKTNIRKNSGVSQGDLEILPSVSRASRVLVVSREGQAEVTIQGIAMEDGWIGDTVFVRLGENREKFKARVIGQSILTTTGANNEI